MSAIVEMPDTDSSLPNLLDRVAKGETFRITRFGAPVAWIFGRNELDHTVEVEEPTDLVARPRAGGRRAVDELSMLGLLSKSSRR
jgi:antitoxin (DNA-binding transcriptional repressor) of toxin-antitoxin stability system